MSRERFLIFIAICFSAGFLRAQFIPFAFFKAPTGPTPATYIQEAETPWNTTAASVTTGSFNVVAGDLLVAYAISEADGGDAANLGITGGGLYWHQQAMYDNSEAGWETTEVRVWSAVVDTNKSMTVTFTNTSVTLNYGGNVLTFRGSGGIGAIAKRSQNTGTPSLGITTLRDNSSIVVANGDWTAQNGAGRSWLSAPNPPTERSYYQSGAYAIYGASYGNVGVAGSKTVGLSAPGSQRYALIAIEVLANTSYDPCSSTPVAGSLCSSGTIYAGTFDGGYYMVTPPGCTNSTTPTCVGDSDTTFKYSVGSSGYGADIPLLTNVASAATPSSSSQRGYVATKIITEDASVSTDSAAHFCQNMTFGGYSDWYLPSKSELAYIYCLSDGVWHQSSNPQEDANCASVGGKRNILVGFAGNGYVSSTEIDGNSFWREYFGSGFQEGSWKPTGSNAVRCVRRYYAGGADVTPNYPTDWTNFTGASSALAISGIDTNITLEISATNGIGAPNLAYRKNGGAWTTFTTIMPASVGVVNGDTLQFNVIGTSGDSATITITNTSDSNSLVDTVTGNVVVCPANYSFIPANTSYVNSDFCAMRYEAKAEINAGGSYDSNGLGVVLANYKPASLAANGAWQEIDRNDSIQECQSLGTGYDLMANAQWQTIARNLEMQGQNWTSGTVGTGCLYQGNNGETNCGYDASGIVNASTNRRGIFALSNGVWIYDLAGNAKEWLKDDNTTNYGTNSFMNLVTAGSHTTTGVLADGVARSAKDQFGPQGSGYSSSNNSSGLGRGAMNAASGSVIRGGNSGSTSWGGIFSVELDNLPTIAVNHLGFRCVYNPTYDATPPDATPTAVNWVDFNLYSQSRTLTGFNIPITLQFSAVNGTGAPTIQYRKNATAGWTTFTTASPATVVFSTGETLEFRTNGTLGHSATITVTNVTDGNTVLDTVTGTVTSSCVAAGGAAVNGQCWFIGALNQSCTAACSNATGYSNPHTDTITWAGSGGSNANCTTVLDAFPATGSVAISTHASDRGCNVNNGATQRRRGTTTTTYSGASASWSRACACVTSGDVTPDAVDWTDFSGTSISQTLNNFGTAITLSLSAVNGTGTPTLEYRKNGGTWTAFTTGSPASVSFAYTDTLEFRVTGTSTHSATITVTNTSNGNAVLDTLIGTVP